MTGQTSSSDIAVNPADPNCATCRGKGKVIGRDGREWRCTPCSVRLSYETEARIGANPHAPAQS
ncbi:hypothetical protein LI90_2924 [Carbonactinospora thermoautotrophica]|uniref:Uncharacterized protein n=1 Tax=Carbonactinospora thermoautotrophica TaxID=1469144 RepID=A0A132MVL1_9ACTN|nr:hypothetical protein [Carbonactinospora thermoautotrophica]KWX01891.1 hypothetical protein LI90_2924 [Carbonactinospora thermoautotrophica]